VLTALGIGLLLFSTPFVPGVAVVLGGALYFTLGLPFGEAVSRLRSLFLTILFISAFSLLFTPPMEVLVQVLRLTALMLFAATVTATTTVAAFMEGVTAAARPLERIGLLKADDIGLAFGLVVRFVPEILSRYEAIREAHVARGLKVRPVTLITPLIILTLKEADQIAAAIDARGLRSH
jgi:biotin transport system permease protein